MSILGSSANCNQGSQNANALTNKYCGSVLNPTKDATVNVPICGKILEGTTESTTYFGLGLIPILKANVCILRDFELA